MEWVERNIGEVCDLGGGEVKTGPFGSQLHQSDYEEEGIPVVMPKDIIDGYVDESTIARVSDDHVNRLSRHKLSLGDIVYGRRGDIGRQALVRKKNVGWLCGTGCLRITLGSAPIDSEFLHLYLRQPDVIKWISNQAIGATMPNLNTSILRGIPIRFPKDKDYQKELAATLTTYDNLIENNNRRIAILEEMAQSLYREWFVKFRFPGHEDVKFIDSPLGKIPEGWEVQNLSKVINIDRGRSYKSSELVEEGGYSFLNLKNVAREGGFRRDGLKRYNGPFKPHQVAKPNDIIMAVTDMTQERAIIARPARVPNMGIEEFIISMDLVKITVKEGYEESFIYSLLRYSDFPHVVKQFANGANVLHLSPKVIEEYQAIIPSASLRKLFSENIKPTHQIQDKLERKNDNLKKQRDMLLPKLISGNIKL
jgi:type I restriction enzyme, S subunit